MSTNSSYSSTLLKAFDLLDCFTKDKLEMGIKEIADNMHMPQSSVYRIIQSLAFSGLVYQNRENKKYRIGPKMTAYAEKCTLLETYKDICYKYMLKIAGETDETVNLGLLDRDRIIYARRITCKHVLRPDFALAESYPAYKTGLGLALIADLNHTAIRWIYDKNASDINLTFDDFLSIINNVRKNGYAFDDQVFCEGLRCVAAPVRGPGGKALFSISVSAPTLRMDDKNYCLTKQSVIKYASQASMEIQEL